jgi:hypothetical protein
MDEIHKAAKSLLSDIESMEGDRRHWFDGFSEFRLNDDGTVAIEWPNLALSAERLREVIEGQ